MYYKILEGFDKLQRNQLEASRHNHFKMERNYLVNHKLYIPD